MNSLDPLDPLDPLPTDVFARRLRQERERRNISQAELARRVSAVLGMNVDPSTITRIEQARRAARVDEVVAAAKVLDVPVAVLLSDDPVGENEAWLRRAFAELAREQQRLDQTRLNIRRLSREIQAVAACADPQSVLDLRLRDDLDARVSDEESTP
ncbi:helix-turn-helix transcriptional regulator [Amycolatopsis sp. CA-230715]|uniref:helix-turn-helix transcriptional regulator n=1 Tax=Amycolatopsis sp. CA-230715 TaxID=2745196 RepID=UPI001C025DB9|nr:helix-turn-helix transcriptional regulator [Amycolatopsis sp. CA-230715]QWF85655.1 hypothetical protein HUW46_09110 [Amycolatopsis sp. CA-230715]